MTAAEMAAISWKVFSASKSGLGKSLASTRRLVRALLVPEARDWARRLVPRIAALKPPCCLVAAGAAAAQALVALFIAAAAGGCVLATGCAVGGRLTILTAMDTARIAAMASLGQVTCRCGVLR